MLSILHAVSQYLKHVLGSGILYIIVITGIISFLSNCVPYLTVPYLAIIFVYTSMFSNNIPTILLIVFISSLGAALGKIVVYLIGKSFRRFIVGKVNDRDIELFNKLADKGIFFAIFLFAATPLPDDVLYIIVGALKYSPLKFFLACLSGKFVITEFVALSGQVMGEVLPTGVVVVLSIIITIIVILIIRRVDWNRLIKTMLDYGMLKTIDIAIHNPKYFLKSSRDQ